MGVSAQSLDTEAFFLRRKQWVFFMYAFDELNVCGRYSQSSCFLRVENAYSLFIKKINDFFKNPYIINPRGNKCNRKTADGSPYAMKVARTVKARYKSR